MTACKNHHRAQAKPAIQASLPLSLCGKQHNQRSRAVRIAARNAAEQAEGDTTL